MANADSDADVDEQSAGDEPDEPAPAGGVSPLVADIAVYDEAIAGEVGELQRRVSELEAELEDRADDIAALEDRLRRERADFQNYKRRTKEREAELKARATEALVERLLDVRDNLARALSQEDDADVRDGVEATLSTFDRVLEGENVAAIEPDPGDEVDPTVHEVVMRVDGEQPEGSIEDVYRPGYEMGDRVLRPAQVTVSMPEADAADQDDGDGDGDDAATQEE